MRSSSPLDWRTLPPKPSLSLVKGPNYLSAPIGTRRYRRFPTTPARKQQDDAHAGNRGGDRKLAAEQKVRASFVGAAIMTLRSPWIVWDEHDYGGPTGLALTIDHDLPRWVEPRPQGDDSDEQSGETERPVRPR